MINSIISFSIRNKLVVGLFVLGLIFWGGYSLSKLPIDALPDITSNQVQVITQSPALAASEVEKFITYPLEISLRTIPNVKDIRSISRMGMSIITVVFEDEVATEVTRQQVAEKLKAAEPYLLQGSGIPELAPITTGLGEFFQYTLEVDPAFKDQYSLADLRTYQDWIIKRQLLGIKGVVEVSSYGGHLKQYEVAVDPERLRAMNVSVNEVFKAIQINNSNSGGGYIEKGTDAYFIRSEGMLTSLEDIENTVVSQRGEAGLPVLVKDVAKVGFGKAIRYGAMTRNGKGEAVGAVMLLLKGANANQVVQDVKAQLEIIGKTLPQGVHVVPYLDRSVLIGRAINTVEKNLIEGGLIVVFILVLLLGNLRAGLIVASVIPLCLLFAFALMHIFGVSANLMSLGAIDFGLIVDGAVIIVESIIHRLHSHRKGEELSQQAMDEEVGISAKAIFGSAAFGVIIILIVYLPIMALGGIEGKMFRPMAQTVSFAILGALILSLTYVPMMSALFLSKKISHEITIADRIMGFLYRGYQPLIHWALKQRKWVVIGAFGLFSASIALFMTLGGEFIPELNEGDFAVETILPTNASLSQSIKINSAAQAMLLKKFPTEVKQIVSRIGASEIPTDPMGVNACDLIIQLKDPSEWKNAETMEELEAKMDAALDVYPEVNFEFTQPIQMRFNELIAGVKSDIAVKIFGEDLQELFDHATEASRYIRSIDGVGDIKVQQIDGIPQLVVKYNRVKMAQYGLNVNEVNSAIKMTFAGETAGIVMEGEKRFDLVVRMDSVHRQDIQNLRELYIDLPSGSQIPLQEVAEVNYENAPLEISRDNTHRRITIGINVRGRDVESVVADIQKVMKNKITLPAGYYVTYGGTFENLQAAKSRLALVVPIALALIFVLLFFTFQSFLEAAIIYLAIPLSAIGGVVALWLRGMPFSVSAGIGFIALFGVAVLNGIVLLSFFKQLADEGLGVEERLKKGLELRFRPVIMTAAVASLGFLPMALSHSPGAEVQRPLATVVIGGLITATFLTLVVIPVVYSIVMGRREQKLKAKGLGMIVLFILMSFSSTASGLSTIDYRLSTSDSRLPTIDYRLSTSDSRLPTIDYRLSTSDSRLPTIDYRLSLKACLSLASTRNALLATGLADVKTAEALINSGKELPKGTVDAQYGRVQTYYSQDYTLVASQSIPWPTLLKAQVKSLTSAKVLSEKRLKITQNLVASSVKFYYYQILAQQKNLSFLASQDSLYTLMKRAATIKFQQGETNRLELMAAETRLREFQQKRIALEADQKTAYQNLAYWINEPGEFEIEGKESLAMESGQAGLDLSKNPTIELLAEQVEHGKLLTAVERERLKPDLRIGVTTQSIENVGGQNFVQAGLAIPIFGKGQKAKIASAKLQEEAFVSQKIQAESALQTDYKNAEAAVAKYRASLAYYTSTALPQAALLEKTALKSYQQGEIEYVEMLQNTQQAWQIRESYIQEVNAYNQAIITRQTIIGNE
ncbi:CusA/CzcA family heavy metal efflux RND transporter [Aquirufa antheringensis]|uniref:CusA/CzcA family heavy metal efflux RND transporter n=1 Tax=Aquirufa antheringensis TaxID=2516559 RepID=UPI001032E121|nr:CusA/CzcA family heavy metal efflux RND transporter [Aquirufa antheringensis]TBH71794.1 CusA/CzcA family heavy metal efflux RND transporter [Aquirufa antheringensis]